MKDRKKPYMLAGTASSAFTNEKCSPMTTQWVQDTYALPRATVQSLLAQGLDSWFFVTVDYTFGKTWQTDTTKFIEAGGGKVVGSVLHPLNSRDFSSFLLRAQSSRAKVIALANSGADFANVDETGAGVRHLERRTEARAARPVHQSRRTASACQSCRRVRLTTPFYWDRTDETRAFAKRYQAAFDGRMPNEAQASTYSAVHHYLKAVAAAGSDDGDAVMRKMREHADQRLRHEERSDSRRRPGHAAAVRGTHQDAEGVEVSVRLLRGHRHRCSRRRLAAGFRERLRFAENPITIRGLD